LRRQQGAGLCFAGSQCVEVGGQNVLQEVLGIRA
jgi:hypothetical protein